MSTKGPSVITTASGNATSTFQQDLDLMVETTTQCAIHFSRLIKKSYPEAEGWQFQLKASIYLYDHWFMIDTSRLRRQRGFSGNAKDMVLIAEEYGIFDPRRVHKMTRNSVPVYFSHTHHFDKMYRALKRLRR